MSLSLPVNLVPLPTMPWDVRPEELPLTIDEARTAIWMEAGNITKAALRLKVDSARLRRFVRSSPRLSAEMEEAREQILDRAEDVVVEALNDLEDVVRRDSMAKHVLTNLGRNRGYGSKSPGNVNIVNNGGKVVVQWGDGTSFDDEDAAEPKTINHEAAE